ncbi:hypothetical protein ACLOJK_021232 [Asimina triloba]
MALKGCLLLVLAVILHAATVLVCVESVRGQAADQPFNRKSFPDGFIFGAATSAYQALQMRVEEARAFGILSLTNTQKDVEITKDMGMDAYRFSISWSRILPNGTLGGGINKQGIEYYNNLIDEVISKGMKPFVTLFHWDVPQFLEDKYGGFLSREITDLADVCFWKFGDRVKHWITLNEPWSFSNLGYGIGMHAPGRCSACSQGYSPTEPYKVAHNLLLAHAAVVQLYRNKFQEYQKGVIGITLISSWVVPYNFDSVDNYYASKRAMDFMLGWYMDPLTGGDYPRRMRDKVGERLPKFSEQESALVNGSFDFIGINYYTTQFAKHVERLEPPENFSYSTDWNAHLAGDRNTDWATGSTWLYVYPRGLLELLVYTSFKYNNPVIYITENGVGEYNDADIPLAKALNDKMRVDYHHDHLSALLDAIRSGVDVRGYFAWSLVDNFEWANGYTTRFGLTFVDYKNNLKRHPKLSALWFKKFLKKSHKNIIDLEEEG